MTATMTIAERLTAHLRSADARDGDRPATYARRSVRPQIGTIALVDDLDVRLVAAATPRERRRRRRNATV